MGWSQGMSRWRGFRLSPAGLDRRAGQGEPGVQVLEECTSPHKAVHPLKSPRANLQARNPFLQWLHLLHRAAHS